LREAGGLVGLTTAATIFVEAAIGMAVGGGLYAVGALEGLARVRLAQGQLDPCEDLLDRLEASVQSENDRTWYVYREAELTRAHLLARRDFVTDALSKVERVLTLAIEARDTLTVKRASLTKAELCVRSGDVESATEILRSIVPTLASDSPELIAHAEHTGRDAESSYRAIGSECH